MKTMTIKAMQDRINFLYNAIADLSMAKNIITIDGATDKFFHKHAYGIANLERRAKKSTACKAHVTSYLEEAETRARAAVVAFYEAYGTPELTDIDQYVDRVKERKTAIHLYLLNLIAEIKAEKDATTQKAAAEAVAASKEFATTAEQPTTVTLSTANGRYEVRFSDETRKTGRLFEKATGKLRAMVGDNWFNWTGANVKSSREEFAALCAEVRALFAAPEQPAETAPAAPSPTKMQALADEIKQFLVYRDMWIDVRIYFDGKAYCSHRSEDKVIENIDPRDFFDYVNPETLSMSFEGSLYEAMNYGTYGWDTHDALKALIEKHGYYFEIGNAWNLTLYPIG